MAKSTCLHIQDRESGPIRVVEIPWASVRVGRAAYCEVRLSDPDLADVACQLKRRGQSWQLIPAAAASAVRLDGRPLDGPIPLPYGEAFQVGAHCLTLRQDQTAQPDWGMYQATYPRQLEGVGSAVTLAEATKSPKSLDAFPPASAMGGDRTSQASQPSGARNSAPVSPTTKSPADILKHRWETRWRAAGAEIKSRAERIGPSEPARAAYGGGFRPVPIKEARAPQGGLVAPAYAMRPEKNERRGVAEPRAAEFKPDRPNVGNVAFEKPSEGHLVPASEEFRPAESVEGDLAAAPVSFWDHWAPTDEIIDSLRQDSLRQESPPRAERSSDPPEVVTPAPAEENIALSESSRGAPDVDRAFDAGQAFEPEILPRAGGAFDVGQAFEPDILPRAEGDQAGKPDPSLGVNSAVPLGDPNPAELVELPLAARSDSDEPAAAEPSPAADGLLFAAPVPEKRTANPARCDRTTPARGAVVSTSPAEASRSERAAPRSDPVCSVAAAKSVSQLSREEQKSIVDVPPVDRPGSQAARAGAARSETPKFARQAEPKRDWARDVARASTETGSEAVLWPSARDILAMHDASRSAAAQPAVRNEKRAIALPTVAREPGRWSLPAWLAGPPIAVFVLAGGIAGCVLSLAWAGDSCSAAIVTERLLSAKSGAPNRPLPDGVVPPDGSWIKTTAQHLAHWALYLSRSGDDAASAGSADARGLLERAAQVSPLDATARLALAQLDRQQGATAVTLGQLGLSRDVLSLASSASWLLAAGKKEAALKMYRQALEVGSRRELARSGVPRYSDDPAVPRYLLPGEESVREVVRSLVTQNAWSFAEWSQVLPRDTAAPLAAARLLREQGKPEAEQLIDLCLQARKPPAAGPAKEAVRAAARAEAHALLSHWKEAEQEYRQAIDLAEDDTIKRAWWFNLADIALHLDDERQRQAALKAALAVATSDDITRRATERERSTGPRGRLRSTGAKAN